jgi:hypothetical protein
MQAISKARVETDTHAEPASEHTQVQRAASAPTIPVEQLEYHLFVPRAHDPLLDSAYELWRDVWQSTFLESDGIAQIHADEFTRQDEIGVLTLGRCCISVTGVRWLDLSLARWRDDSYFRAWPEDALASIGGRRVCIGSNTAVHPDWRRTLIEPPRGQSSDPVRLSFTTLALSVRRFVASSADSMIALTRNDRSIDRVTAALGTTQLARLTFHGNETDAVCVDRSKATPEGPVVNDLWRRRHQP